MFCYQQYGESLLFSARFWFYIFDSSIFDLTKEPSDWLQKQATGASLRKIKSPFSAVKVEEVNSVRQVESETLEPPSIFNRSISSPAAERLFVSQ